MLLCEAVSGTHHGAGRVALHRIVLSVIHKSRVIIVRNWVCGVAGLALSEAASGQVGVLLHRVRVERFHDDQVGPVPRPDVADEKRTGEQLQNTDDNLSLRDDGVTGARRNQSANASKNYVENCDYDRNSFVLDIRYVSDEVPDLRVDRVNDLDAIMPEVDGLLLNLRARHVLHVLEAAHIHTTSHVCLTHVVVE